MIPFVGLVPMVGADSVAFWVLAPVMVLAALGMVLSKKPVHSALCLATVMVSLAVQYAALGAPFLFAVQIIVYTGAILMLFLFVVMLVGVDTRESLVETIRGQRVAAVLAAVGFAVLLLFGVGNAIVESRVVGIDTANAADGGNVVGIAYQLFSRYVLLFEATSALLITAALGAMVLAHRERIGEKINQRQLAGERIRRYAETGEHPGTLPTPGVFARHNAVDIPALLPDGTVAENSVAKVMKSRGTVVDGERLADATKATVEALTGRPAELSAGTAEARVPARREDADRRTGSRPADAPTARDDQPKEQ